MIRNPIVRTIEGEELRRLQLVLLENLIEFDRVCRANKIKYIISSGTFLGAVRNRGFIPWDDDADIYIMREEYEKFKTVQDQLNPEICFFQDNDNEKSYPWGYGKIRRMGTEYVRYGQEHLKHRTGMFIDIFPMDDIPQKLWKMKLFEQFCFLLRKMTYSHVGCKSDPNPIKRIGYKILSLVPLRTIHKISRIFQNLYNDNTPNRVSTMFYVPDGLTVKTNKPEERYGLKKEWLTDIMEYEFEGHKFWGPSDFDGYLSWSYGKDYMIPPPIDKRISHSPCSSYSFNR